MSGTPGFTRQREGSLFQSVCPEWEEGKGVPQEDPHSCRGVDWARGGGLRPREGPLKPGLLHPQRLEGTRQPRIRLALRV